MLSLIYTYRTEIYESHISSFLNSKVDEHRHRGRDASGIDISFRHLSPELEPRTGSSYYGTREVPAFLFSLAPD
jgi:hypothetical protein